MLAAALEAEVNAYIAEFADERDAAGRRLVVRNGHHQPRKVTTAAGAVDTVTTYLNASYDLDSTLTRMGGQWYRLSYRRNASGIMDSIGVATSVPGLGFAQRAYSWDAIKGRLTQIRVNGQATTFDYNADGQRLRTTWPGGIIRGEEYTGK